MLSETINNMNVTSNYSYVRASPRQLDRDAIRACLSIYEFPSLLDHILR